jgi:hypothetical protein
MSNQAKKDIKRKNKKAAAKARHAAAPLPRRVFDLKGVRISSAAVEEIMSHLSSRNAILHIAGQCVIVDGECTADLVRAITGAFDSAEPVAQVGDGPPIRFWTV